MTNVSLMFGFLQNMQNIKHPIKITTHDFPITNFINKAVHNAES